MVNLRTFEAASNKYRPDQIKALFIAEAPPAYDSGRFFYFAPVETADTLYLEMMKVLYPRKARFVEGGGSGKPGFDAKAVRNSKLEFLEKFKQDGFFLIDAAEEPMPGNATTKMKEERLSSSLPQLRAKLDELRTLCGNREVPVILIGAAVYKVCAANLRNAKVRVLNENMINHPARGGQKQFRRKLRDVLRFHHIESADSCS